MSAKPQSVFDAISDAVVLLSATREVRLANAPARALGLVTHEGKIGSEPLATVLKEFADGRIAPLHRIELAVRLDDVEVRTTGAIVGATSRGDVFVVVKVPDTHSADDSPFRNLLYLLRETTAPALGALAAKAAKVAQSGGAPAMELSAQARELAERVGKLGVLAEAHLQGPLMASDRIELCVLVRQLLRESAAVIGARALKVGLVGCEIESPVVYGSRLWLERALREYLEHAVCNAIPGSAIEIRMQTLGGHVGIVVSDHGRTIPAKLRAKLLEPFSSGPYESRPTALPHVGLAICKRIVQMHGGDVRIESAGDVHGNADGSRDPEVTNFVLELPTGGPPAADTALGLAQAQRYAEDLVALMRRRSAKAG